jgi:1,2-dihydroxy-3-keto-5-methylthiopentene dioxygenase
MAQLRFHDTGERLEKSEEVIQYLEDQGIIYQKWDISKLPDRLRENFQLTEEEKASVIETFRSEIDQLSAQYGYITEDIVVLSENTPNLDQLLTSFKEEHHHSEDEVRFIVSGHGIFAIKGANGRYFDTELEPGDLISVPASVRHYFTLMEDRKVVAIRIFKTKEGWVPIY